MIEVWELLPENVGINADTSAFTVYAEPIVFQETLGDLCQTCIPLDGLTVPKPAFNGEFHDSIALPDSVESAQVLQGKVVVATRNGFGFDPLRPPGGGRGSFTLSLRDGGPNGPVLDEIVVNGDDTSFGPGASLTRELEYSGPVSSSLFLITTVNSPAGGPEPGNWVPISVDDELRVTATPGVIEASSADIALSGKTFDMGVTGLEVAGVSPAMVDRIQSGAFRMEIQNPWSVGAVLNLTLSGPTLEAPIALIARVPGTATSYVEVEFSQADLQAFLGQPNVIMTGQGTVDSGTGVVSLAPDQTMDVETRLFLVILVG